tara:strand:- start:754 stop:930 length:177 start_codon:yes stop_codon:yes gene_type:complete
MTENPKTTISKEFSAVLSPTAREGRITDNLFGAFSQHDKISMPLQTRCNSPQNSDFPG